MSASCCHFICFLNTIKGLTEALANADKTDEIEPWTIQRSQMWRAIGIKNYSCPNLLAYSKGI